MSQYHINPETLKPGRCFAKTSETCKFNNNETVTEHYSSKQEAIEAAEKQGETNHSTTNQLTKNNSKKSKTNSKAEHIANIQEAAAQLGMNERLQKQFNTTLNDKSNYNQRSIEFNDRNNAIKYLIYPDRNTKQLDKIEIFDNGGSDHSQEELNKIAENLTEQFKK